MKCKRCGSEMKPATAMRLRPYDVDEHVLDVQPSMECVQCGMLFVEGKWVDMRADPDDVPPADTEDAT